MEYSLTYKIENYNIAENVVKVFSGNVTQSEKKDINLQQSTLFYKKYSHGKSC